jgi:hypothetical protein
MRYCCKLTWGSRFNFFLMFPYYAKVCCEWLHAPQMSPDFAENTLFITLTLRKCLLTLRKTRSWLCGKYNAPQMSRSANVSWLCGKYIIHNTLRKCLLTLRKTLFITRSANVPAPQMSPDFAENIIHNTLRKCPCSANVPWLCGKDYSYHAPQMSPDFAENIIHNTLRKCPCSANVSWLCGKY